MLQKKWFLDGHGVGEDNVLSGLVVEEQLLAKRGLPSKSGAAKVLHPEVFNKCARIADIPQRSYAKNAGVKPNGPTVAPA